MGNMLLDIGLSNISLLSNVYLPTQGKQKKKKRGDSIKLKTFLYIKGKCNQNKNVASSMGEHICKQYIWWGIKIQNIQGAQQFNIKKTPNNSVLKMNRRTK